jgi:CRP/FNR family transcriptional regulator, cyclic AMP receptor protein
VEEPGSFDLRQWLSGAALDDFDHALRPRRYNAGQTVYRQDEPGTEMFRIVSGLVRLSVLRSDGREVIFLFFRPGDCFGDSSLVDGEPRPQTAEALTDLVVQVLDGNAFHALRDAHRAFDGAIMKLLARQMRALSEQFVDTSLNDLTARVAARILQIASALGSRGMDSGHVALRLPQAEIASMVGASRQSVSKTLQRLQSEGLVTIEYANVLVNDVAGLRRLVAR